MKLLTITQCCRKSLSLIDRERIRQFDELKAINKKCDRITCQLSKPTV